MRFKPTITKAIASVLGGFILGLFGGLYAAPKSDCNGIICVDFAFPARIVILSVLSAIMGIYVAWSLMQKK